MSKPFDNIDNAYITRLGYEYDRSCWVEKAARAPTVVDVETNEEAEMDIPLLSPIAPPSPYSPPHVPSVAYFIILMIFWLWMFFMTFLWSILSFYAIFYLCLLYYIFFYDNKKGRYMLIYKDQGGEKFIYNDKGGVYELLLTKGRNSIFFIKC